MRGESTEFRRVSAALFNNAAFAEILIAADQVLTANQAVTTRQVAASTGRGDSVVRPILIRLVQAGLLADGEDAGPRTPRPFTRSKADVWAALIATVDQIDRVLTEHQR